jgi:caspase domain-containing protein
MPNRAIVVAIQAYPELLPALQGPVNDAKKFFDWVTTHGGVDVAAGDATLILGDDPPAPAAVNARPTPEAIKYQFDLLEEEANHSPNGQAGDRLYLYLSGHGFGQDLSDASLLMANATQNRTRHHIPGRLWADHFFVHGYFKEVLLFLDCCRERYSTTTLNGPGTSIPVPPAGARCFYGFAAKYGLLAVERNIDGQMGGVFTATLLDALTGGASEEDGRITGETLKAYLYENMKGFLSPEDLADKDVAKEPDLYCAPPEKDFVIATVQPHVFNVTIPLPPGSEGSARQLFGEKGGKKYQKIADAAADGSLEWRLPLSRGTYGLFVNGASRVVTVKGRGITDVS